jgi:hypothetical protein
MRVLCIFGRLVYLSSSGENPALKESKGSKPRDAAMVGTEHLALASEFERSGLFLRRKQKARSLDPGESANHRVG